MFLADLASSTVRVASCGPALMCEPGCAACTHGDGVMAHEGWPCTLGGQLTLGPTILARGGWRHPTWGVTGVWGRGEGLS